MSILHPRRAGGGCNARLIAESEKLSVAQALLAANVALQIVKAMRTLYSESEAKARQRPAWLNLHAASIHYRRDPAARRPLIEAEFQKVLTLYLNGILSEGKAAG